MDLNLVVICGQLATAPDLRVLDSGPRLLDLLVAIRSDHPHPRVDVLPVAFWDPPDELIVQLPPAGAQVWVTGSVQRRFWEAPEGRRSRVEIVAQQIAVRDPEPADGLGERPGSGAACAEPG